VVPQEIRKVDARRRTLTGTRTSAAALTVNKADPIHYVQNMKNMKNT
jgi:hypothetical protein